MRGMKRNNYPPVVVVGLNNCSLSLVRSLGRKGINVIGLYDGNSDNFFLKSRYCALKLKVKSLYDKPLVDFLLNDLATRLAKPAALFCATDMSALTISKHEDELKEMFKFVLPPYTVANDLISKKGLHAFALENSFLVPNTFSTNNRQEIEKIADKISYPCIIKPEFRDRLWCERVPEHKVLYADSKENLMDQIKIFQIEETSLIIQEWIDGDDSNLYFCMAYLNRSQQPLAICTGRKLRQYPIRTGTLSVGETIWLPEIANEAIRFLRAAGCVGFGAVEFKRSKRDGRLYVIEPTVGRPEAIAGIFTSAGLDVPFIAYLDAIGSDLEPIGYSRKKIKWINEPLEFYSVQNYPNYGGFKDFISVYKGKRYYSIWAYDDPLPVLIFLKEKVKKGINRVIRRGFKGKQFNNTG